MGSLERPKLRPLLAHRRIQGGRVFAALEDSLGVFTDPFLIPIDGFREVVSKFDGKSTLAEIRHKVRLETGQDLAAVELERFVAELDRAMVLDGPTFGGFRNEYLRRTVRPAAFAGRSYAGAERTLREQLDRLFSHGQGAGLPTFSQRDANAGLRGIISPHIDFQRGGPVYTWAYRELVERSDADVFVILGVAHQYCTNRFALTGKDFDTPLGLVKTDRTYVDRVASIAGTHLFDDELAHRTEHSIEFQAVFLQYLLGGRREFAVVPILVGSFHDLMEARVDPYESREVRQFVGALRTAERESGKKVAYIGGVDLSHVGSEFGDREPVGPSERERLKAFDLSILDRATSNDAGGWFQAVSAVENRSRVCGLAAVYTMLHAMGPTRGRLLRYDQAVDDRRTCCVSFASVAFDADRMTGP